MFEPRFRMATRPSVCCAHPEVVRNIKQQIRENRSLSRADVRFAAAMGLLNANVIRPAGMDDGVFYPLEEVAGLRAPLAPSRRMVRQKTTGKLHALCLLVDFSDNRGKRPADEFRRMLFDSGNPDSMSTFYDRLSRGALKVDGEVLGYIRAPHPYSYYANGNSGMGERDYPRNTPGLLFDALTEFCKTDNLARFDTDGDGYVDGVFLVHAGGGAEAEPDPAKRPNMIWSHKWTLPSAFESKGVKVYAYSTEPEDGRVGVFAHEFGHVLGLPDLYDTSYRSRGIGDWCLMAGGSWGGGGDRPVRMSCWCLSELGWIKPSKIAKSTSLSLPTLEVSETACYRVKCGAASAEYFLLENRQATGMDRELPGSGLAVWHIDESQSGNDHPGSYRVALVQADGRNDLERNRNSGDSGDLFPGSASVKRVDDDTTPATRTNDGSKSGIALSRITMKNREVTLDVTLPAGGSSPPPGRRARRPARRGAGSPHAPGRRR